MCCHLRDAKKGGCADPSQLAILPICPFVQAATLDSIRARERAIEENGVADEDCRPLGYSLRAQQLSAGRDGAMSLQKIARCSRAFVQRQLLCVADLKTLASSEGIRALATASEGSCARAVASYRQHCTAATWRCNAQVLSSNAAQFKAARVTPSEIQHFPSCNGRLQYA